MPIARMNPEITAPRKPRPMATQVGQVLATSVARCSQIFANTTEGAGRITGRISSARTAISHSPKNAAKTRNCPAISESRTFHILLSPGLSREVDRQDGKTPRKQGLTRASTLQRLNTKDRKNTKCNKE